MWTPCVPQICELFPWEGIKKLKVCFSQIHLKIKSCVCVCVWVGGGGGVISDILENRKQGKENLRGSRDWNGGGTKLLCCLVVRWSLPEPKLLLLQTHEYTESLRVTIIAYSNVHCGGLLLWWQRWWTAKIMNSWTTCECPRCRSFTRMSLTALCDVVDAAVYYDGCVGLRELLLAQRVSSAPCCRLDGPTPASKVQLSFSLNVQSSKQISMEAKRGNK